MSRTAQIRAVAASDTTRAQALLADFLHDLFGIAVRDLTINHDQYSLNSLNGFFDSDAGPCFFKFHQEEGEEQMRGEYYRAELLARAGLPVDQPLLASTLPGEQILVYRRREDARFSDVLRALDLTPDAAAIDRALAAEAALNDHLLATAIATLHPITPAQAEAEPVHRLFHQRLTDPATGAYPGGRMASFYTGQTFQLPGVTASWEQISTARPVLQGVLYAQTIGALFDAAAARLAPGRLADAGGITAHGDAHNANIWYQRGNPDHLSLFDPAFAGLHVPALLAEIKATFHNAFAHPFWLYDARLVPGRYGVTCRLENGQLHIGTDWTSGDLRGRLLQVKAAHFWQPWLAHLQSRALLPPDWEDVMRLALFLCPTLVMNLRAGPGAGPHNPQSSAIGLMVAVMAGSRPVGGQDHITRFFDAIRPGPGGG